MATGFIYLWRDSERKRFYLGSHFGAEDDGYVCGSKRMLAVYKKRPHTFKRRVIRRADIASHVELKRIEQQFLDLIEDREFGDKYYNFSRMAHGADPEKASLWMRGNQNGKGKPCSVEKRRKISESQKGKIIPPEQRIKFSAAGKGNVWFHNGEIATRAKIAPGPEWKRGRLPDAMAHRRGMRSPERGARISAGKKRANEIRRLIVGYVHSPETRAKISESKRQRLAVR